MKKATILVGILLVGPVALSTMTASASTQESSPEGDISCEDRVSGLNLSVDVHAVCENNEECREVIHTALARASGFDPVVPGYSLAVEDLRSDVRQACPTDAWRTAYAELGLDVSTTRDWGAADTAALDRPAALCDAIAAGDAIAFEDDIGVETGSNAAVQCEDVVDALERRDISIPPDSAVEAPDPEEVVDPGLEVGPIGRVKAALEGCFHSALSPGYREHREQANPPYRYLG